MVLLAMAGLGPAEFVDSIGCVGLGGELARGPSRAV